MKQATCSKCKTKYTMDEDNKMSHPAIECKLPEDSKDKDMEGIYCMMCLLKGLPKLNFK